MFAIKGGGNRPLYRWLERDWQPWCPQRPERPRLCRLCTTPRQWTERFVAAPTIFGVIDTYGMELSHPIREGRRPRQIGNKGSSNHRWIVGGKWCLRLTKFGVVVAWDSETANVDDHTFQSLIWQFGEQMMVCSETAVQARAGDPSHRKRCARGAWHARMLIATVLSMLTLVTHFKQVMPRVVYL
jgi:hypothetical protein